MGRDAGTAGPARSPCGQVHQRQLRRGVALPRVSTPTPEGRRQRRREVTHMKMQLRGADGLLARAAAARQ
eukprot:10626187-Lingulodinium_polyedra.AAC.1